MAVGRKILNLASQFGQAFDPSVAAGGILFELSEQIQDSGCRESLLLDVLEGDHTPFLRFDEVEWSWRIVDPILTAWREDTSSPMPEYEAGSSGPTEANALLDHGRKWQRL